MALLQIAIDEPPIDGPCRQKTRRNRDGKKRKARKWYYEFRDHFERRIRGRRPIRSGDLNYGLRGRLPAQGPRRPSPTRDSTRRPIPIRGRERLALDGRRRGRQLDQGYFDRLGRRRRPRGQPERGEHQQDPGVDA